MNTYHIALENDKKNNSFSLLINLKEGIDYWIRVQNSDYPLADKSITFTYLGEYTSNFMLELINEYKISKIVITNFINITSEMLEYISNTSISSLSILSSSINTKLELPQFPNIKSLLLGDNVKMNLDFSKFPQLEHLSLLSYKSLKGKIENKTDSLKEIIAWYYNPKSQQLQELLAENTQLKRLEINHTNIPSLAGIEQLENLEELSMAYGRNLENVSSLLTSKKLKKVQFENCKKIADLDLFTEEKGYNIRRVGSRFVEITRK